MLGAVTSGPQKITSSNMESLFQDKYLPHQERDLDVSLCGGFRGAEPPVAYARRRRLSS